MVIDESGGKLALSVQAFNKDDSVEFQKNRWIRGLVFELFQQTVAREIDKRLKARPTRAMRILDVGCGSGPWIEALLEHVASLPYEPRIEIKGIDAAKRLIACARKRLKSYSNVSVESCAFQDFKFRQRFEIVYFVDVIQHFDRKDYPNVFSRLSDLVAPGGTVIVIDKERYSLYALRMWFKRAFRDVPDYYQTAEYPSFSLLADLGRQAGFHVRDTYRKNQFRCLILIRRQ